MSSGLHPFNGRVSRHFMDLMANDHTKILSYHSATLFKLDLESVKDSAGWLTDNVIAFWEEYLEREILSRHEYRSARIILLRPTMSYMLAQTAEVETIRADLPDFAGVSHIFLPINDKTDPNQGDGGEHWSLLLVSVADGMAFHYDSLRQANVAHAQRALDHFARLLGRPLEMLALGDCPQQANGTDCGVYVCSEMKYLLTHRLLRFSKGDRISMSLAGRELNAAQGRKEIAEVIEYIRKEGERRRPRSASPMTKSSSRMGND